MWYSYTIFKLILMLSYRKQEVVVCYRGVSLHYACTLYELSIFVFLSSSLFNLLLNPITYGIWSFRQLPTYGEGGGGRFGPDPENKVTVNGLI